MDKERLQQSFFVAYKTAILLITDPQFRVAESKASMLISKPNKNPQIGGFVSIGT